MNDFISENSADSTHVLEVIKVNLDCIEIEAGRAGSELATRLIGAASEAISDELRTRQKPSD